MRHLNREFFDLRPSFKLIVSFNNKPVIRDPSEGIWRRMLLVAFTQTLPREQYDLRLPEKMRAEGPGILNWMLDGFRMWRERGLSPPESVAAATREYRADSDPIGNFLGTATVRVEGAFLRAQDLFACYEGWCEAAGLKPVTSALFGQLLNGRGIERENKELLTTAVFSCGLTLISIGGCPDALTRQMVQIVQNGPGNPPIISTGLDDWTIWTISIFRTWCVCEKSSKSSNKPVNL